MDDFGIKYECQEDITHLLDALKTIYKKYEDWDGNLYCDINLEWGYYKSEVLWSHSLALIPALPSCSNPILSLGQSIIFHPSPQIFYKSS